MLRFGCCVFWRARGITDHHPRIILVGRITSSSGKPSIDRSHDADLIPLNRCVWREFLQHHLSRRNVVDLRASYMDLGALQPAQDQTFTKDQLVRTLINAAKHLVWCSSLDGKLLYVNRVAERIYGKPLKELTADPNYWLDAIHPDDRPKVVDNLADLLKKKHIEQDYRVVRPNGSVIWLHDRVSVVHDASRKPKFVGGIGTDISAIRESEALYSSLVERMPMQVVRKDLKGKVVFGNQLYCQSMGMTLEEVIGKTDLDLFPRDLADGWDHPGNDIPLHNGKARTG